MHDLADAPLPTYDNRTDAVQLYSETQFIVMPNGTMKKRQRSAYKILRPNGAGFGIARITYDLQSKVLSLQGWCIPASGKDYEVKQKDAVITSLAGVTGSELITDIRTMLLRIPAATPGAIVGYEVEQEHRPYMRMDEWYFQSTIPVREARYSVQLPAGWSYRAKWLNHPEQNATTGEAGTTQWVVKDVGALRLESSMPPWRGVAGRMTLAIVPPDGQDPGPQTWSDIGSWYVKLTQGRRDPSADIKKKVTDLTAGSATLWQKMQALAKFSQDDIRYVAIELGIGGYQPHRATETFTNRFGDCKDKVTLLSTMLKELGVDSHFVIINTERGSISATSPPTLAFNHVIIAIQIPNDLNDANLLAVSTHPKLGRILYFDPTDELTPFGRLSGALQANYGLLVGPDGGELASLPKLSPAANGIHRTAQLKLDEKGTLQGDVVESWTGDLAAIQRQAVRTVTTADERIKPAESVLAASLTAFEISHATIANSSDTDKPFEWKYSFSAPNYAKTAADLLLVRPRVLGSKSSGFLEVKDPRIHAIEFDRPQSDQDVFEIALPSGYVVEELPPPLKLDTGFLFYQSKTELANGKLKYTRSFEVRELNAPADKAEALRQFYRSIGNDERLVAVLKRTASR